ncbi:hypothetical protein BDZ97DRAFT_1919962 [Flammula alnicola]|nr:hypothetical protein BDZ97DRAFT_1919962 [Flammula alnicola]
MVSSCITQHNSATDYEPTKCTLFGGKPCSGCLELAELDVQLAQVLADFEQKRRLVKSKVNNLHDPLAYHLPVEVISEIFTWYHEETYKPSVFGDSDTSDQGSPLRLAAVCKTWREIAFQTPQLWTSLHIVHDLEQITQSHLELVAQWLGRSSKMPLYIRLQDTSNEEEEEEADVYPASLFALIAGYAPGAPLLEYLRLAPTDIVNFSTAFSLGKIPCLRSLNISHVFLSNIHVEWDNLTSIQLKAFATDEILEVLSRARRVVDCKFLDIVANVFDFELSTSFLTHHSLTSLHLQPEDENNSADLCDLYDRLVLPSLQHFSCDSEGYTIPLDVGSLLSLFTRSRSPITHFSLAIPHPHILPADYDTLMQILENLPSITHLSLVSTDKDIVAWLITNKFLQRMASFSSLQNDISPTTVFLPHLESLHYEGWWPSQQLPLGCLVDIFYNPVEDNHRVETSKEVEEAKRSLRAIHYRNRRPSLRYFNMTFYSRSTNIPEPIEFDQDLRRLVEIRTAGVNLQIRMKHPLNETSVVDMIESAITRKY